MLQKPKLLKRLPYVPLGSNADLNGGIQLFACSVAFVVPFIKSSFLHENLLELKYFHYHFSFTGLADTIVNTMI